MELNSGFKGLTICLEIFWASLPTHQHVAGAKLSVNLTPDFCGGFSFAWSIKPASLWLGSRHTFMITEVGLWRRRERLQDAAYLSAEHWKLYDSWNVINVLCMHREPYSRSPYWGMIKPIENPILWAAHMSYETADLHSLPNGAPSSSRHSIYLPSEIGTTPLLVQNGECKCLVLNPDTREGWIISFTLWPY